MRRFLVMLWTVAATGGAIPVHAGTVSIQFVNRTNLSFDYSLQLANQFDTSLENRSFLGKNTVRDLGASPAIGPQQGSHWQSYEVSPPWGSDVISFNMLLPDGKAYGLRYKFPASRQHSCQIPADAHGVNVSIVLEQDRHDGELRLLEYSPDGDVCRFPVEEGFGPSLWGDR
ncbi:MAG: hypothetical protein KGJ64_00540 [Betaproteobacteria bacterium]|nr:hypothetical protein [Betaproteobacteria bacterium]